MASMVRPNSLSFGYDTDSRQDNTFRDEILEPPPISEALSSNSDDAILAPYEPSSEPAPAPKKKSKKPKRGLASPSEQPLILATQQPGAEVYPTSSQPAEEVRPTEPPASLKLWDAPVIDRREDSLPRCESIFGYSTPLTYHASQTSTAGRLLLRRFEATNYTCIKRS